MTDDDFRVRAVRSHPDRVTTLIDAMITAVDIEAKAGEHSWSGTVMVTDYKSAKAFVQQPAEGWPEWISADQLELIKSRAIVAASMPA